MQQVSWNWCKSQSAALLLHCNDKQSFAIAEHTNPVVNMRQPFHSSTLPDPNLQA
jgi:hypothetical protein